MSAHSEPGVDLLAFGTHPDDVEITSGGLIAKLTSTGRRVAIVDFTRGEMGTRGDGPTRDREALAAARVLGLAARENLGLPDGLLATGLDARRLVIEAIRRYRPTLVLAPIDDDLHPDHEAAGKLVKESIYPAGFPKYPAAGEPWRPRGVIHYMGHFRFEPSLVVETTGQLAVKMEAIRCYASQLHREGSSEPVTGISRPDFLARIEARDRYYGSWIGATFGEPFLTRGPVPVPDPFACWAPR